MTMSSPGMTSGDPFHTQPESPEESVATKGFYRVMGTGRRKPALRAEPRGNDQLVQPDRPDEWKAKKIEKSFHSVHA